MYDNPSADKFGPPPGQERFEAPKPRRGPQWFAAAVGLALWIGRYQLEHTRKNGWVLPVVLAGIFVAEFLVKRRHRDARDVPDPNTPNVPQ